MPGSGGAGQDAGEAGADLGCQHRAVAVSDWCLVPAGQHTEEYTEERGGGSSLNEKEPNHCSQKQT